MDVLMQMGEFHEGLNMFVEMKKWFVGMDTHRCLRKIEDFWDMGSCISIEKVRI